MRNYFLNTKLRQFRYAEVQAGPKKLPQIRKDPGELYFIVC